MYTDTNTQDRLNVPSHGRIFLTYSFTTHFNLSLVLISYSILFGSA